MAKAKHPDKEVRPGLDYYEYKQLQETARLRRRALEANLDQARREQAQESARKNKMRVIAKIADEDPAKARAQRPQPMPSKGQPQAAGSVDDAAEEAQLIYQSPDELDAPSDLGYDENDVEISNPFADALGKIRQIGGKLLSRRRKAAEDFEDAYDEDEPAPEQPGGAPEETIRTKAARLKKAGRPGLTLALSDDDEDEDIDRRSRRKAQKSAVHAVSNEDTDPLGVMRPYSEEEQRSFMRPSAEDDELHRSVTRASKQRASRDIEAEDASLTAQLSDDLDNIPALSRRERKALASAGTLSKPATRKAVAEEDVVVDEHIDEPTQQFKPLRYRMAKPQPREPEREVVKPPHRAAAPIVEEEEYDDDEPEEEDEYDDVRKAPPRRFGRKRRVYRDEEYAPEYDEEDDYADEDDYDGDYDEDDEDYDDYDEEEALNEHYHVSFGKHLLALIKGLLIVVLVFLLLVVLFRQLEASGIVPLDKVRDTVGQMLPIELLFPKPEGAAPVEDEIQESPLPTDLATPEPSIEPTADPAFANDSQGSPLEGYAEDDGETQGMGDYDELEGYSEFGDDGGEEDLPGGLDAEDDQPSASMALYQL